MSFVELDNLIRQRQNLISWLSNAKNTDSQSGQPYHLRVDINGVKAMYCGQAYAGANNYHDAPGELNAAFIKSVEKHRAMLLNDAATALLASINTRIMALKALAEEAIVAAECRGIEIEPGVFSGCDAHKTGANDCPSCGTAREGGGA